MSEEVIRLESKDGLVSREELLRGLEKAGFTVTAEAQREIRDLEQQANGKYASDSEALQALIKYVAGSNKILLDAILKLEARTLSDGPDGEKRTVTFEFEEAES